MTQYKLAAVAVLAVLLLILVLQNTEVVAVRFFFWELQMSRVVLILVATLIGFLCGYVVARVVNRRPGRSQEAVSPGGSRPGAGATPSG
jgi:uncharacterized integral membrane protein